MVKKSIFAEHYRPKKLDEVIGQDHVIFWIKKFVKNKHIPHMMFSGIPGCGKTTTAIALARDLYGNDWKDYFLELNASDERKIDDVRVKVKGYAEIKVIDKDFKIIFLDECDSVTPPAQAALRRIIEKNSSRCRFILSCVTPDTKILLPNEIEITIDDFMKNFENKTLNKVQNFNKISSKEDLVLASIKLNPKIIGKKTLAIKTMTGRTLKLTEDHKLLTNNGWKQAGTLTKKDKLFIFPHLEKTHYENNNNKIINIDSFINFLSKYEEQKGYKNIDNCKKYSKLKTLDKKKIIKRIHEIHNIIDLKIGLTKKEYEIYKIVKNSKKTTINNIYKLSNVSKIRIRGIIKSIENKGFIERIIENNIHFLTTNNKTPLNIRNLMDIKNIIENEYNIKISYKSIQNSFNKKITKGMIDRVIKELKHKNLLDLTYNNITEIGALSRIVSFIFGDGHLVKNNKGVIFIGNKQTLKEVKKDLQILGYNGLKITTKEIENEIYGRKVKGKTTYFTLNSISFSLFLQYLGVPKGDKVSTSYNIPYFVKNGTKFVKREFIKTLFGCDGDKPSYKKYNFYSINLRQNKIKNLKDNMMQFYEEIKNLFNDFDIESYITIRDRKEKRKKDLQEVFTFELSINSSNKNLFKFFSRIGYSYEEYKINLSKIASEYLRHKLYIIESMKEKKPLILQYYNENKSYKNISKLVNCSTDFVVNQLKNKDAHLPRKDFLQIDEWINKYKNNNFIENEIIEIKEINCTDVRDITCFENHNFISNGFISHNCNYPNKIIEPIIDRCVVFRFRAISVQNMRFLLKKIIQKEDINITDAAISTLAVLSNGSMRRALNILETLKFSGLTNINEDTIYNVTCYVNDEFVMNLLRSIAKNDLESVDKRIDDLLDVKTYQPSEILESLYRLLKDSKKLPQEAKLQALTKAGDIEFRISMGAIPKFQLKTFMTYLMLLYKKHENK